MNVSRLIVVFEPRHLPARRRYQMKQRKRLIEKGMTQLTNQFPQVSWGNPLPAAASVLALVPTDEVHDFTEYVKHSGLGWSHFDGDYIVAAGQK